MKKSDWEFGPTLSASKIPHPVFYLPCISLCQPLCPPCPLWLSLAGPEKSGCSGKRHSARKKRLHGGGFAVQPWRRRKRGSSQGRGHRSTTPASFNSILVQRVTFVAIISSPRTAYRSQTVCERYCPWEPTALYVIDDPFDHPSAIFTTATRY